MAYVVFKYSLTVAITLSFMANILHWNHFMKKRQAGGKLFFSKIKFELQHVFEYSKEVTWIACMRHWIALMACVGID